MKAPSAIVRRIGLRREQQQCRSQEWISNPRVFLSLLTAGDANCLRGVASEFYLTRPAISRKTASARHA